MRFAADFHIHSKYSRATSPQMNIDTLSKHAKLKGIALMGTGDFTHPGWLYGLKKELLPAENGLFKHQDTFFMLTAEVSNLFVRKERGKKVHNILFAPSFETVEKINGQLERYGDLSADGRPMLSLEAKDLVKIVLDIDPDCLIVPAHAWTPWFSVFGSNSGFDSVEECFEEETTNIYALETGLSSDPPMNWRLSELDKYTLISNSDSHSPAKIGREANIFDCEINYKEILEAIKKKDRTKFLNTIEFFPEEGKYHYDGHRPCNLRLTPAETKKHNGRCPSCGGRITVGVMSRVEKLADRPEGFVPENHIPCIHLIPLVEIISKVLKKATGTTAVENEYLKLTQHRSEFDILTFLSKEELHQFVPPEILQGILNVRTKKVIILPGYDGVYGEIEIPLQKEEEQVQLSLF
ncbi:MAG: endonuclease Q family protein [bacterium]|nr:endonuclease Q family protein [bacterium]